MSPRKSIVSPVGAPVSEARRRRARSPGYRAEQERLAPYEAIARFVIQRRAELGLTQEQLADAVGLTSVHVNRVLKQLGDEGLISRDKRSITIEDWPRMRDAGDFNERYLHHEVPGNEG